MVNFFEKRFTSMREKTLEIRKMVLAGVFAALTAVGAFLRVPLGLMSFTLQVLFTAMAGVALGAKWGAASQAVYVALGLIGLPVFTQGGGLGYLLQPSFGFLLGLIPMAAVIGALCGTDGAPGKVVPAYLAGLTVLYLVGVPYMGLILNLMMDRSLSVWAIVRDGMLIYLPGDAVKLVILTAAAPALCRVVRRT